MRRATAIHPPDSFQDAAATVTLTADRRHRRRIRMTDDSGEDFLLDLPNAVQLRDGDGLALEDGDIIRVIAAREEVADIRGATPEQTARLAWHVGNRHVPVEILPGGGLRVAAEPVLLAMAEGLGAQVTRLLAPFHPEPGAYDPHGLLAAPDPVVRWG
jgi:urease accessory protein